MIKERPITRKLNVAEKVMNWIVWGNKKVCTRCLGKGWYVTPNGEDDYDKEVCDCQLN